MTPPDPDDYWRRRIARAARMEALQTALYDVLSGDDDGVLSDDDRRSFRAARDAVDKLRRTW